MVVNVLQFLFDGLLLLPIYVTTIAACNVEYQRVAKASLLIQQRWRSGIKEGEGDYKALSVAEVDNLAVSDLFSRSSYFSVASDFDFYQCLQIMLRFFFEKNL